MRSLCIMAALIAFAPRALAEEPEVPPEPAPAPVEPVKVPPHLVGPVTPDYPPEALPERLLELPIEWLQWNIKRRLAVSESPFIHRYGVACRGDNPGLLAIAVGQVHSVQTRHQKAQIDVGTKA